MLKFYTMSKYHILIIIRCLFLAVPAILFLQSGIDKVVDFKGNLAWLKEHFSKSIFKKIVSPLLISLTILELLVGALAVLSIVFVVIDFYPEVGSLVFLLGFFVLICLFLGQRIAKDYAGAASLVSYMVFLIISMFVYALLTSKFSSFLTL